MFVARPHVARRTSCAALCASLFLSFSTLLGGCSNGLTPTPPATAAVTLTGNWQFASSAAVAASLPAISGELSGTSAALTGILHADAATACIAPTSTIAVTGSANAANLLTLTGSVDSGTLTITGTLAANGKSLSNASYTVSGGACAFATPAAATAQSFAPITGNYAGNFADVDGQVAQVTANFSQSTTPDANGNFTLAGTATVSNNPCFPTTVPVSNTQVTGGAFTFTYAANGNSVTANGTFSSDATTLTVTNWTSSGTCGADSGTGSMTQQ